jgi:hypothetical protein
VSPAPAPREVAFPAPLRLERGRAGMPVFAVLKGASIASSAAASHTETRTHGRRTFERAELEGTTERSLEGLALQTPAYSDHLLLLSPWIKFADSGCWETGTYSAGMNVVHYGTYRVLLIGLLVVGAMPPKPLFWP